MRVIEQCAVVLMTIAASHAALAAPRWLTGEVHAAEAQTIVVPPSENAPVVLRYLVADGSEVQRGDVLVRIDAGASAAQVQQIAAQIEQAQARSAKEVAELEVKSADAERGVIDAEAALDKAQIDAAVPRTFLSQLDADRFQGELARAHAEFDLKQREHTAALAAASRRREDARLELAKLQAELVFHRSQVDLAEQRADRAGVVVIGFDPWRGQRYAEGASTFPGQSIGQLIGSTPMQIRAYALEPDRAGLALGQSVRVAFDALPMLDLGGRISAVSAAPEARAQWGEGRYFSVDIELDVQPEQRLLPGMSARVSVTNGDGPA